ncbi:HNH endonuclease [Treponema ruminis]|uniref:5-methylcytosine-specific restriction endonuclease McrA n=1 Tax=Treponema ruminis TaxID=744515 RepID=A0A7W8GAS7_9SPIR|nr:HNH endonuclease [Treponema ruminis]MBB5226917.1 5-methylcytosine-specific restriction endonuclease McrA [Treponema ruminis]QSI01344.1 HNH endonuclease [Treponema ruminis]
MAFTDTIKKEAFSRAKDKCEKCGKQLVWTNHNEGERGAWQAHHKTSVSAGGKDYLSNCMILCLDCHKKTRTYGSH